MQAGHLSCDRFHSPVSSLLFEPFFRALVNQGARAHGHLLLLEVATTGKGFKLSQQTNCTLEQLGRAAHVQHSPWTMLACKFRDLHCS